LPAKAGSASAAAIIKDKASIAAIFRSTLNTSYLHYVIITQRRAQVLRPLCVAFNKRSCEAAIYSRPKFPAMAGGSPGRDFGARSGGGSTAINTHPGEMLHRSHLPGGSSLARTDG
jgi:hypothetical protein